MATCPTLHSLIFLCSKFGDYPYDYYETELNTKGAFSVNPIALRAAKALWNFGLSECNRVKATLLHSEPPKLFEVLAVLNAIGLKCLKIYISTGTCTHAGPCSAIGRAPDL